MLQCVGVSAICPRHLLLYVYVALVILNTMQVQLSLVVRYGIGAQHLHAFTEARNYLTDFRSLVYTHIRMYEQNLRIKHTCTRLHPNVQSAWLLVLADVLPA